MAVASSLLSDCLIRIAYRALANETLDVLGAKPNQCSSLAFGEPDVRDFSPPAEGVDGGRANVEESGHVSGRE